MVKTTLRITRFPNSIHRPESKSLKIQCLENWMFPSSGGGGRGDPTGQVSLSPYLRMERDLIFETLYVLVFEIPDGS